MDAISKPHEAAITPNGMTTGETTRRQECADMEVCILSDSKDRPLFFTHLPDRKTVTTDKLNHRAVTLPIDSKLASDFCKQLFDHVVNNETHRLDTSFLGNYPPETLTTLYSAYSVYLERLIKKKLESLDRHLEDIHNNGMSTGKYPFWHEPSHEELERKSNIVDVLHRKKELILDFNHILDAIFAGVVRSYSEELRLTDFLRQQKEFSHFDMSQIWRFFIDEKDEEIKGKYGYENEPGYLAGCYRGFRTAISAVKSNQRIDSCLLEMIHEETIKDVFVFPYENLGLTRETSGMRESRHPARCHIFCNFTNGNLSQMGLEEMIDESKTVGKHSYKHKKYLYQFSFYPHTQQEKIQLTLNYTDLLCDHVTKSVIDGLLSDCYREIESHTATDSSKETAIAYCVLQIERIHPFHDGNCRTIGPILTNALRVHAGLEPMIWRNPNMLDGYSTPEIVQEQRRGARRFMALCSHDGST